MSIYKFIGEKGSIFLGKDKLFKFGFNLSPMYRRSTAKIVSVSKDLMHVTIKLPISYKNRNYMNSIFGGSLFAAVDPIPMIQLVNIIGTDYVMWDRSAEIIFKITAKENLSAEFIFTQDEINEIKNRLVSENEINVVKTTKLTNKDVVVVITQLSKKNRYQQYQCCLIKDFYNGVISIALRH